MAFVHRLEQGRTEHGRQDQGNHHRQEHGRRDGYRELAVDNPGGPSKERHGAEYRGKHQADADQRAGDLFHGLGGRLTG